MFATRLRARLRFGRGALLGVRVESGEWAAKR